MKIYTPSVSNEHLSVLPCIVDEWIVKSAKLNSIRMLENWKRVDFELKAFNKSGVKRPVITLLRGALAFRKDLESVVMPKKCSEVELLPIMVSDEEWFLVNCMLSTDRYDTSRSTVFRRGMGEVYMIDYLYLLDPDVAQHDFFYLADSNRSTLLVMPQFAKRISASGLGGIEFREIGDLASASSPSI